MIINDFNNKKYIEISEDKFIIYRWYGKRTLKREKIKGAVIFDDMRIRILYGNSYKTFSINNVKSLDNNLLQDLINKLNKENTIYSLYDKDSPFFYSLIMLVILISNFDIASIGSWIISSLVMFLFLGWPIYFAIFNPIYNVFMYNYKDGIIELKSTFTKRNKKINVAEDEFEIRLNGEREYIFSYNGKNNVYIPKNVLYPANYNQVLKELYNIKNPDGFDNDEITFCYYCGADVDGSDTCPSCGKKLSTMEE